VENIVYQDSCPSTLGHEVLWQAISRDIQMQREYSPRFLLIIGRSRSLSSQMRLDT
jgi:hypothetical protein